MTPLLITYTPKHFLIVGVKHPGIRAVSVSPNSSYRLFYDWGIGGLEEVAMINLPPNRYGEPFLLSEAHKYPNKVYELLGMQSLDSTLARERLYLKNPMGEKEPEMPVLPKHRDAERDEFIGAEYRVELKQWHSYEERTFKDAVIVPIL